MLRRACLQDPQSVDNFRPIEVVITGAGCFGLKCGKETPERIRSSKGLQLSMATSAILSSLKSRSLAARPPYPNAAQAARSNSHLRNRTTASSPTHHSTWHLFTVHTTSPIASPSTLTSPSLSSLPSHWLPQPHLHLSLPRSHHAAKRLPRRRAHYQDHTAQRPYSQQRPPPSIS